MSTEHPKSDTQVKTASYDPKLSSKEMQHTISALGIKKANTKIWQLLLLGVLAGLYIALGAQVFLVALQQGMGKIVAGAVFSVGLVLVVVAGAELFTGNLVMIVGAIGGHFRFRRIYRNWITVYSGNLLGCVLTAILVWHSGLLCNSSDNLNGLGRLAAGIADAKLSIPFVPALIRGFFCNILVILAIILATISKDVISKIFCCILPITAFVACGFEHCIANLYLIPLGFLAKGASLAEYAMILKNIVPVTIGNILGGLFVILIHPNRLRQLVMLRHTRRKKGLAA
ncbi:MAG: formate/nitrite transporter family protein [Verrucomicrobiota bacterium]